MKWAEVSSTVRISTGYQPRTLQEKLHREMKRFNVLVCHRRFGKTVFAINEAIDQGLRCKHRSPQVAYVAPFFSQAKRVAWDLLVQYTQMLPGVEYNQQELRVDIPRPHLKDRVRIMLLGADNANALRGIYLDGAILDEYANMDPDVFSKVIRPALADRIGWCIFIGTVNGVNHFSDMYERALKDDEWYTALFKASETGIIPQAELEAARKEMSEDAYRSEMECDWSAAITGAYYGKIISELESKVPSQVCSVPYDPSCGVIAAWDLGIGDTTAIWMFQRVGREIHVIDCLEMSGVELEWFVKKLKAKPYVFDEMLLPHDAEARELGSGKTRLETLRKLWSNVRWTVVPRQSVDDGIHAVRSILPMCWFDREKTADGLRALKSYQKKFDSKNKIYIDKPLHDWASNYADAFRMFAMGERVPRSMERDARLPRTADNVYDLFGRGE